MDSYNSILSTLAYADIFDYPLTEEEIFEWLISLKTEDRGRKSEARRQKAEDRKYFAHSLQLALDSHLISVKEGFYYLSGRDEIIKIRQERERYSTPKLQRAEKVAGILRLIPWIKLIGITGGLARKNADRDDDIDLFFITANNRLWLTRGVVVLILSLLGLYRRKNKIANMICPNMFVSADNLRMRPEDVYMAHEVCLMRPIFVQNDTYQRFLDENSWVSRYLPNFFSGNTLNKSAEQRGKISGNQLLDQFLSALERVAKQTQVWYMHSRRTTETVSDNLIKFHPHDVRGEILEKWAKRLKWEVGGEKLDTEVRS